MYFFHHKDDPAANPQTRLPDIKNFDFSRLPALGHRTPRSPRQIALEAEEAIERVSAAIINGRYQGPERVAARYYLEQLQQTVELTELLSREPSFFMNKQKLVQKLLRGSEIAADTDLRYALGARARHIMAHWK